MRIKMKYLPRVEQLEDRSLMSANVVLEWNQLAMDAIRQTGMNHLLGSRAMAISQAAVFDAVNAIDRSFEPYFADVHASSGASLEAAAAQAAHDTLVALFPSKAATFDAALAADLVGIPPGRARQGVEIGQAVAQQILAWRSTDKSGASAQYFPGTDAGDWQPTPPAFLAPLGSQWRYVTPFAMTSGAQFLPPPPPALDSPEYATAINEVATFGGNGTTTLTVRDADQTEMARFWADGAGTSFAFGHWNMIAQGVAEDLQLDVVSEARLFALLNIATADAIISSWDTKYEYNFWRPVTAIRATTDPDWTPLLGTPNFPSYTSGHSTISSAAAAVLTAEFGDVYQFTVGSEGLAGVTRSFDSFGEAAAEAGQSRIYGGIHFQFENQNGLASGDALGQYVVGNILRSVDDADEGELRQVSGVLSQQSGAIFRLNADAYLLPPDSTSREMLSGQQDSAPVIRQSTPQASRSAEWRTARALDLRVLDQAMANLDDGMFAAPLQGDAVFACASDSTAH